MFSATDNDRLQQIMEQNPEIKSLVTRLLKSHRLEISTISHEIRNPLTLVYSTLQLIESQHPEVLAFRHWDSMHHDIEYMNQLLEELSSYNNGGQLHLVPVDTAAFLKKLSLIFASSLVDTDIEFTSRIAPKLPQTCIDSVKISQTILNLLRNARDAVSTPAGDVLPAIGLSADYSEDMIQIIVTDNGCGIAPQDLSSIFEPFITHKDGGTGLGLAISRRIIKAHGGTICAASTLGKGSAFTVTLPVQQDA